MPENNMRSVSVVMGVHNGEKYLSESIESILTQRGINTQLIVVNDGSTDSTAKILMNFAAQDPRVRVIEQDRKGLTIALTVGCKEATGDFIARQDADDISLPDRLQKQVDFMETYSLAFCASAVRQVTTEGDFLGDITVSGGWQENDRLLREGFLGVPCHGCIMIRRDSYQSIGGYRPSFYFAQDADLCYRLIEKGSYGCLEEVLYELRVSVDSISGSHRSLQARFHTLAKECAVCRRSNNSESPFLMQAEDLCDVARNGHRTNPAAIRKNRALSYYMIGTMLLMNKNKKGRSYLLKAIAQRPAFVKSWARYLRSVFTLDA